MQPMPRLVAAAAVAVLLLSGAAGAEADAFVTAAPDWADPADATIHPGVQTVTVGSQCTANFVFHDATDVFIGQAAHCASTEGATNADGWNTQRSAQTSTLLNRIEEAFLPR